MGNVVQMSDFTPSGEVPPKQQEPMTGSKLWDVINRISQGVCNILGVSKKAVLIEQYGKHRLITKDLSHFTSFGVSTDDIKSDGGVIQVKQDGTIHNLKTLEAYNSYAKKTADAVFNILDFFELREMNNEAPTNQEAESAIAA